jgi:signal transduction histidine kinase
MVETIAAARAAVASDAPSVIVIDPELPDGDGTTFIREVRSSHNWVQVFVISGDAWSHRMPQFIAAGATDVAVKPFDAGKLPGRVEALLRASETAHSEMVYRQQLESRLQHLGRVATLGTLSATVAHEIANPLTLISADVEAAMGIVDADTPISRPQQEELREIVREIRVAAGIIQNLAQRIRTFARRDEPNRVIESLDPIVDTALLLLKPRLAARRITLHRPQGPAPVVPHYPIRLTQALLNLLTNAIEAVHVGGTIGIRYVEDSRVAVLAVDDNGPGLTPEALARVSEPFFTSKPDGTGLGLLLVRTIMREHDGRFDLAPGPSGCGVSARLTLPLSATTHG